MHSSGPTDDNLVRSLHEGDHAAFACVYADHRAAVFNLCARILLDREEAADVTQDVFLTAFRSPPAAVPDVHLRPWLLRVATNACFNVLRGRRARGGPADADLLPMTRDPFEQSQTAALIERSLGEMNERYRAALVLKDLHGLGTAELADVMAVSRPTADVLVHRSRAAFRKAYAALAGEGAVAPSSLALVLVPLQLPATLAALPPLSVAPLAPALPPGAATPTPVGLGPAGLAGPAGAGLLAKLGLGVGAKVAAIAAGAALVTGGGIAVREMRHNNDRTATAHASALEHQAGSHAAGGGGHDTGADHRHLAAEHAALHAAHDHASGPHAAQESAHHQSSTHAAAPAHAGDASGEASGGSGSHATSGGGEPAHMSGDGHSEPSMTAHDGSEGGG